VSGSRRHFLCAYRFLPVAAAHSAGQFELIAVRTELRFHRRQDALTEISQMLFAGIEPVASFVQRGNVAVVSVLVVDEPLDLCLVGL